MTFNLIKFFKVQIMNKKTLVRICFICAIFFICGGAVYSQTSNLTWNELKIIQKEERISLGNVQRSELNLLLQMHKLEIENIKLTDSNNYDILTTFGKQREERKDLQKSHSDERTKLAQIQAEERQNFLQKQKP